MASSQLVPVLWISTAKTPVFARKTGFREIVISGREVETLRCPRTLKDWSWIIVTNKTN